MKVLIYWKYFSTIISHPDISNKWCQSFLVKCEQMDYWLVETAPGQGFKTMLGCCFISATICLHVSIEYHWGKCEHIRLYIFGKSPCSLLLALLMFITSGSSSNKIAIIFFSLAAIWYEIRFITMFFLGQMTIYRSHPIDQNATAMCNKQYWAWHILLYLSQCIIQN